jgi:hypothetical protein
VTKAASASVVGADVVEGEEMAALMAVMARERIREMERHWLFISLHET